MRTPQGSFRYRVVRSEVVPPTDVQVLASHRGPPTLTLTTCNPRYSAATRLVVTADFAPARQRAAVPAAPATAAPRPAARPRPSAAPRSWLPSPAGSASPWPGALWGLAALVLAAALRRAWRRWRWRGRWLVAALGTPLVALALFMCFAGLSLALPPSL